MNRPSPIGLEESIASAWQPPVTLTSALHGTGVSDVKVSLREFIAQQKASGVFEARLLPATISYDKECRNRRAASTYYSYSQRSEEEREDPAKTRTHSGRANSVAQDQEPQARTLDRPTRFVGRRTAIFPTPHFPSERLRSCPPYCVL